MSRQKTTVERRGGLEQPVVALLRSAGFPVAVSGQMAGWLKAHAVFYAALGTAIAACGGDSVALADDRGRVADVVAAVDEGFRALARQGVAVTPTPLRLIFTVVPRFIAVTYWQKQLRGPIGTLALAPHVRSAGGSELPAVTRAPVVGEVRRG